VWVYLLWPVRVFLGWSLIVKLALFNDSFPFFSLPSVWLSFSLQPIPLPSQVWNSVARCKLIMAFIISYVCAMSAQYHIEARPPRLCNEALSKWRERSHVLLKGEALGWREIVPRKYYQSSLSAAAAGCAQCLARGAAWRMKMLACVPHQCQ